MNPGYFCVSAENDRTLPFSHLGMLVRYVSTLWNSCSSSSPNARYSGKIMMGLPFCPRPPGNADLEECSC